MLVLLCIVALQVSFNTTGAVAGPPRVVCSGPRQPRPTGHGVHGPVLHRVHPHDPSSLPAQDHLADRRRAHRDIVHGERRGPRDVVSLLHSARISFDSRVPFKLSPGLRCEAERRQEERRGTSRSSAQRTHRITQKPLPLPRLLISLRPSIWQVQEKLDYIVEFSNKTLFVAGQTHR